MNTLFKSILLLLVFGLAGCADRPIDIYLFGPAKSCFTKNETSKCATLKVYDKVQVKTYGEKQEVVYVRQGLRLDESNTIVRKLENCKIIDRDNFACDGLVRTNGNFSETEAFEDMVVSTSYWTYGYSQHLNADIPRSRVEFFHDYDSWVNGVLGVIVGLIVINVM